MKNAILILGMFLSGCGINQDHKVNLPQMTAPIAIGTFSRYSSVTEKTGVLFTDTAVIRIDLSKDPNANQAQSLQPGWPLTIEYLSRSDGRPAVGWGYIQNDKFGVQFFCLLDTSLNLAQIGDTYGN